MDIEQGENFCISRTLQDDFLVCVNPLAGDSGRFEKMVLEIIGVSRFYIKYTIKNYI